ncbi:MAG: sigma-54-dependent Fis family transcriptional regulator [Phycisphaerae bacterium]|nr:sigma-54-dependent Fis family transcriptional regulator [Phycisphaerae bacterium]
MGTVHMEAQVGVSSIGERSTGTAGRPLIGQSAAMQRVRRLIGVVAPKDCTVLIQGASGSGKELVARTVHDSSRRAGGPFIAVDCTGLRDTLLESQLFGHVKGAFTGAEQNTLGFIRAADRGTLFLDEIGEMDIKTQAKLLRVIQERVVVPLGGVKPIPVDVRLVAATHRDLKAMVARGEFREDLYFRLDVVRMVVPSLSERLSDVSALADHFLERLAALYEEPVKRLSPEARQVLEAYGWPGNVRELANAIEHAVVMTSGETIGVLELPERVRGGVAVGSDPATGPIITLESAEKGLIERALRATSGNQSKAADLLSIDRRRLYRKVRRYGLKHLADPNG